MSFWTDFEAAALRLVSAAEAEIKIIASKIKPLVIASAEEIAEFALKAVIAEADKVISGQDKLNNAVSTVVTSLAAEGKSVLASTAQAAVQVVYNTVSEQINQVK